MSPQGSSGPTRGTGVSYTPLLIPTAIPAPLLGDVQGSDEPWFMPSVLCSSGVAESGSLWEQGPQKAHVCLGTRSCHSLDVQQGALHIVGWAEGSHPRLAVPHCPSAFVPAPAPAPTRPQALCPATVPRDWVLKPQNIPLAPVALCGGEAEINKEAKGEKQEVLFQNLKASKRAEPASAQCVQMLERAGPLV